MENPREWSDWIFAPKILIQHCERSELPLQFEKIEACGETVLPEGSILKGQKLVKKSQIKNYQCDILGNFQTM